VRAAFKLQRHDRAVRLLIVLSALVLVGIWIGFFYLERGSGPLTREADHVFRQLLYSAVGTGVALFLSLAIACAADAAIDGTPGSVRAALGEAAQRLLPLLGWWLASIGLWIGLVLAVGASLGGIVAWLLIPFLWNLGTLFVVPPIAIDGGGLGAALQQSRRVVRARWGRASIGVFLIGCFAAVASIAAGFVLRGASDGHPLHGAEPWPSFGGIFLLALAYSIAAAAREAFGVILARDALGDLPGEPAPSKPRRRARAIVGRIALAILGLLILLGILGAIFGHRRHEATPSGANFDSAVLAQASSAPKVGEDRLPVGVERGGGPLRHPAEVLDLELATR
jgi:hypothetical protein